MASGNSRSGLDKFGRPLVVVTGLGVVTSLGAGKADNWAKLTAGQSGIRAITRFPTDCLKTRIAGTIDFLAPQSSTAALAETFADLAAEEAIAESGLGAPGIDPAATAAPGGGWPVRRSSWEAIVDAQTVANLRRVSRANSSGSASSGMSEEADEDKVMS